jgi:hypothetical protein
VDTLNHHDLHYFWRPPSPSVRPSKSTLMTTHGPAVAGLRTVVALEATKGVLAMVAGLGLLSLLHHDVQRTGE